MTTLDLTATLASGLLTLDHAAATSPAAAIAATGELDLPGRTMDLALTLQPNLDGLPPIGLRLIGPSGTPTRSPNVAELTRWLVAHQ